MTFRRSVVLFLFLVTAVFAHADRLTEFSEAFWAWRALEQPFSRMTFRASSGLRISLSIGLVARRVQMIDYFDRYLGPDPQLPAKSPN